MTSTLVPLGSVVEIDRVGIDPDEIPSGSPYVGLEHIGSDGSLANAPTVHPGELASTKFRFCSRHVLFGKLRPYLRKVARPSFDGVCSTDIIPVLPSSHIDRDYLFHYLRTDAVIDRAAALSVGMNLPRLNPRDLLQFEMRVPPLDEQRGIAAILDQADDLRRKRRIALEKLNTLPQAIFQEMFGDPGTNPKGWHLRSLSEIGELERGVSKHRPRNDSTLLGGPYPLIQTGDIANSGGYIRNYCSSYSEIGLRQSRLWPRGTLCITIAANIGKTGILDFDACFPDSVVGFSPGTSVTSEYVRIWMSFVEHKLELLAPQFAQKNITLAILRELRIPLPPITMQLQFTSILASLERLAVSQREHLTRLDKVFASLQHRAFSGQLLTSHPAAALVV